MISIKKLQLLHYTYPNNFSDSSMKRKRNCHTYYMNQRKAEIDITQRMTVITEAIVNEDTGMSDTSDSKYYL